MTALLTIIVLVFITVAIWQMVKIFDLANANNENAQVANDKDNKCLHPTQKPVALMEYLIKTYTNEGETILDFTMGSGTTGVACVNTGRDFIGIELDETYFGIAQDRIKEAQKEKA